MKTTQVFNTADTYNARLATAENFLLELFGEDTPGYLMIISIDKSKTRNNVKAYPFATANGGVAEAAKIALLLANNPNLNIYFGLGLQKDNPGDYRRGSKETVIAIPGVWFEADAKTGEHSKGALPATKAEALSFIKNTFPLEPTYIVNSGGGLHCYWLFKEPLIIENREEWKNADSLSRRFQSKLLKAGSAKGWNLDFTGDLARVLRVPGTFNVKREPVEVTILENHPDARYTTADIEQYLPDEVVQEYVADNSDNTKTSEYPPSDAEQIASKCMWFAHCRDDAETLSEPEWKAFIDIAALCTNGRELIHAWSKSYPTYTKSETDKKVDYAIKSNKPRTCRYIKNHFGSSHCGFCGEHKKSPITLGMPSKKERYEGMNLPEYFYFDEKADCLRVSRPLLAKHIRDNLDYFFVKDSAHGGLLKYIYQGGYYQLYSDDMLKGAIKAYITDFDETALRMADVNEVFQQLTTDLVFKSNDELNANENVINFKNGVLRLSDMTLLPHSPELLSTIQIPCEWTGQPSPTPVFDAYISELVNWDKEIENLLLEFIGVCISNIKGHRMKKALFLVGKGDTGKSRLKELTEKLLGRGNFFPIDLRELEERFATGNIYNKRLIGSSDMSFMTIKEIKIFKKLTGGDEVPAEFKGMQGFNFTYNGLLWFCMNKLPRFGGDDGEWVHERIMQVNCINKIPKSRQDKFLVDKLYSERNGIVYKAIMALRQVISNGYNFFEPDSVIIARQEYMEENNTAVSFWKECMIKRPTSGIPANDGSTTSRVYDVYKAWCKDNNHGYSKTTKEFREDIAQHLGFGWNKITTRHKKGIFYRDYTLSNEVKVQYHDAYGVNYMYTAG